MIDADRYEGHTEGPWTLYNSAAHGPTIAGKLNDADWQLITDAPLLLAEVKRWHKVRDYILEKASYPTVKKLHLKDLLSVMEEVIE